MIDLIYKASKSSQTNYWNGWIKKAGLEYLAIPETNRVKPYAGPKIEDLPGLTDVQKRAIFTEM